MCIRVSGLSDSVKEKSQLLHLCEIHFAIMHRVSFEDLRDYF
jgi:hypothetical protein